MKTETSAIDPIWTNNIDMLPQEECLPVIGSCQVSSILQTLDVQNTDGVSQNVDLIILPSHDMKLAVDGSVGVQGNYVVLKDKNHKTPNKPKTTPSDNDPKKKDSFEDMLYFVCNLCPFLCTKDSKITEHVENAHKNKTVVTQLTQLKCPACPNIFYHKLSLRSHLIHDHGVGNSDLSQIIQTVIYYANKNKIKEKESKSLNTPQVKAPTIVKKPLEIEIESIEENEDSLAECNDFIDLDKFNLSQKMEQKQEMKVVVLPQVDLIQKDSDKIFNSLKKQKDPVTKLIDIKKTNKCVVPSCNVKFQDVEKLKYHITCHVENGFECNDCNEKFMFWKTLASHLWRIHKIDMDLYSCDKCDYKTYSLAKLNNSHKLIHSEVRAFTCNICNKAFKNSKQVRNHKMTHKEKTVKLQYSCQVCTKNFTSKKPLKVHMDVVHKNIRPFLCSYCSYKGSSRSSLKMHIRQHTGEKPFSCCYCSYTTSDHNSLRRHKLRHTGQKPYKCSYCSYACIQSSTYKTHLKTKHPGMEKDLMFTCHECQFRSVNKDMFVTHMMTVHKIKPC